MKLFNSLTKQKEDFTPLKKGEVKMYTCGPTVYNYAHIGNFFAYLSADTLYRWLKYGENYDVKWVLNITDVDDKTIRDSKEKYPDLEPKEALKKFCNFYEEAFKKDLEKLNITGVATFPRATDFIKEQQEVVRKIIERGYAYAAEGSVYFDIQKYKEDYDYGRLVHIDEGFKAGARVDQDEYEEKSSAADFVLWKGKKEGEPSWDFNLKGQDLSGRPGWHLECTAMEKEILDFPFDIHTGGMDLKFPHHEDEIAQAQAAFDVDPTKVWMHNGYLQVEGEKMSKSKGNFYRLSELLEELKLKYSTMKDAEILSLIRLTMVTNHYRKNFNFTENGVHAVEKNLTNLREIKKEFKRFDDFNKSEVESERKGKQFLLENLEKVKKDFYSAIRDDLNTPRAWSIFLQFVKNNKSQLLMRKNSQDDLQLKVLGFFELVSDVFGVSFEKEDLEIPQEVILLAKEQKAAKQEKDFARADAARDKLKELGFMWDQRKDEVVKI